MFLSPPAPVLVPLSSVYGAVVRARLALYRAGVLKSRQVNAAVISVGNITAGGTGKTPFVAWLARRLAQEDARRVWILTRGYGRNDVSKRVLVSDGARLLADADEGGDEPRLLAEMLLDAGVAVLSDADRVAAARWALEKYGSEVFILDDGFQHLRLARDMDIVTLDGSDPWGGRKLLPRGRLREPLSGLKRAGAFVITRADLAPGIEELRAEASRLGNGAPVFTSRLRTRRVRPLVSTAQGGPDAANIHHVYQADDDFKRQPLTAFCALGNPANFFAHLRRDGHVITHTRAFGDHHKYTQTDVDMLAREAATNGASALATTAKDAVKLRSLRFPLPCFVFEVELEIEGEAKLLALVRAAARR
ncbi:MAG TPA: tetraacyldisaccharide 4'-kinase [Pyrinomonadaceae bacterium]|jgi:tetraacyldisaccharide 4'-kinase|nr:tetraacyldisaccharide 4'-kinase [Pyrinomonadaceae bacterium]